MHMCVGVWCVHVRGRGRGHVHVHVHVHVRGRVVWACPVRGQVHGRGRGCGRVRVHMRVHLMREAAHVVDGALLQVHRVDVVLFHDGAQTRE